MSGNSFSNSVLEHFKNVRDGSGIPISRQMGIYEKGYKIVRADEGEHDVYMKCEQHELLEYTGEDEFSLIGNIILKDGEFCSAEIIDSIVITMQDVYSVRAFLDKIEDMITEVVKND